LFNNLKGYKEYLILAFLLTISLMLLPLNDNPRIKDLRTFAFGTFAYVTEFVNGAKDFFYPHKELTELKKNNANLMLKVNLLREYGLENLQLKKMLAYYDTSRYKLVLAKVVSPLISKSEGNLIINKGKSDGVLKAMPVVDEFGLAGIVTDVSENFALVRTIKNTKLRIAVTDQRSRVHGILTWNGEELIIKNIPASADMRRGDRIITADFSTIFPPSIPVGIVLRKTIDVYGLLGNVIVKPFAKVEKEDYLFVIKLRKNNQLDSLKLNLLLER